MRLYDRAAAIGEARLTELGGLRASRLAHVWEEFEAGNWDMVFASITFGEDSLKGVSAPAAAELEMPGGVTREMLTKEYMEGVH